MPAPADHTIKAFDLDLSELVRMILEMGGLAEKTMAQAIEALARGNVGLAKEAVELDDRIDRFQRDVEQKAIATIALRQPMAVDLRSIIAILRTANELERIGDLAKNVAKRVIVLRGDYPTSAVVFGFKNIAHLAMRQLHEVLDSLAMRDDRGAMRVWNSDQKIDAMYTSLFREVLTYVMEDPGAVVFFIHFLFSAKNIERIGDHVTNIAEAVHFMVEGEPIGYDRPKCDTTSSIGIENHSR